MNPASRLPTGGEFTQLGLRLFLRVCKGEMGGVSNGNEQKLSTTYSLTTQSTILLNTLLLVTCSIALGAAGPSVYLYRSGSTIYLTISHLAKKEEYKFVSPVLIPTRRAKNSHVDSRSKT